MVDNRISKVFVSSVAALLLLSSVVFLAGTQADASDDLQILDIFELIFDLFLIHIIKDNIFYFLN